MLCFGDALTQTSAKKACSSIVNISNGFGLFVQLLHNIVSVAGSVLIWEKYDKIIVDDN